MAESMHVPAYFDIVISMSSDVMTPTLNLWRTLGCEHATVVQSSKATHDILLVRLR